MRYGRWLISLHCLALENRPFTVFLTSLYPLVWSLSSTCLSYPSWSSYKVDHKRDKIGVFVSTVSTKIPFKVTTGSYLDWSVWGRSLQAFPNRSTTVWSYHSVVPQCICTLVYLYHSFVTLDGARLLPHLDESVPLIALNFTIVLYFNPSIRHTVFFCSRRRVSLEYRMRRKKCSRIRPWCKECRGE